MVLYWEAPRPRRAIAHAYSLASLRTALKEGGMPEAEMLNPEQVLGANPLTDAQRVIRGLRLVHVHPQWSREIPFSSVTGWDWDASARERISPRARTAMRTLSSSSSIER